MPERDDLHRYIEHLQCGMCTPGWEEVFSPGAWKEWYTRSLPRLRKNFSRHGPAGGAHLRDLERLAVDFNPETRFELPSSEAIFAPILEDVKAAACKLGLPPLRDIKIVTSTDVSATPLARPTSGTHLLFVGLGTSSFCNYWSKAFTAVVKACACSRPEEPVTSTEDFKERLANEPSGAAVAARLALHYAVWGTVLGFGEVEQAVEYTGYRAILLRAMESFAVGHEYAHFFAEEGKLSFDGVELEVFCDQLGLQLSRRCSNLDGWLDFTGIGPLVLFRSIQFCETARELLLGSKLGARLGLGGMKPRYTDDYPSLEERTATIRAYLLATTEEDQRQSVEAFFDEYDRIARHLGEVLKDALTSVLEAADRGTSSV